MRCPVGLHPYKQGIGGQGWNSEGGEGRAEAPERKEQGFMRAGFVLLRDLIGRIPWDSTLQRTVQGTV